MIKERIEKLREEIIAHDINYENGTPVITDSEYDKLYLELVALEKDHPEYLDPNSPTNKIHVPEKSTRLLKIDHTSPMLSQEKATTFEEVEAFIKRVDDEILIQEKLDGLTIVLRYQDKKLVKAITRGNGFIGEDVTHIVREIKNVPKTIKYPGKLEVRGEVIMPYKAFEKANRDNYYSNPRNFASGQLRRIDSDGISELGLKVITFDLITPVDRVSYDMEQLGFLESNGFEVVKTKGFERKDIGEIKGWIENYENVLRDTLPHMIDGLVIKNNDLSLRDKIGTTNKHPKWSIAYKFKALDGVTTLLDCMWSVGKLGQITPVAILDTVNIDNVNISKASLHNVKNIRDKDIRLGDRVIVKRSNDVIPFIVGPLVEIRSGDEIEIHPPTTCPSCGNNTSYEGEHLYCTNINCEPQLKGKISHYASRDAMNIDGLGEKTVELFFDNGIVKSFRDVYSLEDKKEKILKLEGFGKKKYDKIIESVEASKDRNFDNLLYGLCIRNIGRTASKLIAKEFKSMDVILDNLNDLDVFKNRLLNIPDFGEIMANSFIDFFKKPANIQLIHQLQSLGLNMKIEEVVVEDVMEDSLITGKTFAITGKLETVKNRAELEGMIISRGGKLASGVSKNVNYLVNNDTLSNSSKNKKAKELGIPIISEAEILTMMQ